MRALSRAGELPTSRWPLASALLFRWSCWHGLFGGRVGWVAVTWVCSLGLFAAVYAQPWSPLVRPGWLEVSGLDVSQGDSLLIVFPRGTTMLVDAGGFPGLERMTHKPQIDIGEDVVSPYLWWRRIRRLDYVVLTHGHSDHMAGLAAVLDNFRPKELWTGAEPNTAGLAGGCATRGARRCANAATAEANNCRGN